MESLRATYKADDDDDNSSVNTSKSTENGITDGGATVITITNGGANVTTTSSATPDTETEALMINDLKEEPIASESLSDTEQHQPKETDSPNFTKITFDDYDEDDDDDEQPPSKKQKQLSSLTRMPRPKEDEEEEDEEVSIIARRSPTQQQTTSEKAPATTTAKKSKKKGKNNNVWTKPTLRKGKKKTKFSSANNNGNAQKEDAVLIAPIARFPDKNDDSPDVNICLSKVYKAEKVELSDDRMSAGSCKGYRIVRATRGVVEGAWYFEIKVVKLGETGHTRLGWSTEKGDLQAPVGYDGNSFGYRDIDGTKIHKALREKYGEEGYVEGDVIGFYINLPEGGSYAPKPQHLVLFKGQRYVVAPPDAKEDPPKVVPGSEISFFRNGICQGIAFKDLCGGRYYPAASMYTLPNQPNCVVRFNFGPDFEFFPEDFGGRLVPRPMVEVPYHGFDGRVENGVSNEKEN